MASLILLAETPGRHICPLGKATLMVGSDDHSDLHLPSSTISKDHASIVFENNEFVLRDNGSLSGSFVNGEPISRAQLKHQDLIRFGEYLFMIDLHDEGLEEPEPPAQVEPKRAAGKSGFSTTSNVTVSESKDGYRKVVNISQPEPAKRQTQNLREKTASQNIRLLLSEPIPYTPSQPRARKVAPAIQFETKKPSILENLKKAFKMVYIPLSILLTAYLVFFFMPVEARYQLTRSEGFQNLPMKGLFTAFLLRSGSSPQKEVIKFTSFNPKTAKITIPQKALIVGRAQLSIPSTATLCFHVYIRPEDAKDKPVLDDIIRVPPGVTDVQFVARTLPPGVYGFECVWEPSYKEGEAVDPKDEVRKRMEIPATLYLESYL